MTATELRVVLILLGLLILAAIYWFGRKRPDAPKPRASSARREPVLDSPDEPSFTALDDGDFAATPESDQREVDDESSPQPGQRDEQSHERIVTLYVVAAEGFEIHGSDLMVAAEKAGMVHGHLNIYHRLVDTKPELGPVFSMANMVRPGHFDLASMDQISTPGVVIFMTLPGPVSALEAWDMMQAAANRLGGLLQAQVLDDQRTPLGRQRIASLRDELRAYDRKREALQIKPNW